MADIHSGCEFDESFNAVGLFTGSAEDEQCVIDGEKISEVPTTAVWTNEFTSVAHFVKRS